MIGSQGRATGSALLRGLLSPEGRDGGNSRNGKSRKRIKTGTDEHEIEVPRDRVADDESDRTAQTAALVVLYGLFAMEMIQMRRIDGWQQIPSALEALKSAA